MVHPFAGQEPAHLFPGRGLEQPSEPEREGERQQRGDHEASLETGHREAAEGFATLTGSAENEVIAMNTLTVNLHLLMASFYRPSADRFGIVIEDKSFPSDRYAAASQVRHHGFDPDEGVFEWRARGEDSELFIEDLEALLNEHGDRIALLLLPGVL